MMGYLLRYYVFNGILTLKPPVRKVVIITDTLPLNKKKKQMVKAIKTHLASILPSTIPYAILHHDSKSNFGLQVADYYNWAILRKWKDGDLRSYRRVAKAVASEFDIFKNGYVVYYNN